ncbi:MAG: wax ester/triacylglycerol synthase family O-acyltransferase [Gammaproteobacteria bacterium]|nr:wax ester/triacylglycerol synthase family O-acyltransferase [Gammaproteobacteria bacterium]
MKQLGILDSAFINLEQSNTPQHVGGLGIYDPSSAEGGFVRFKQVITNFEQRLQRMPLFRTRLVEVPGGIDRPYWVKDANFDVEFHLRHIALPEPGDWRQLCIQVARLHARQLDMSRPLWEAYIIEGLDNIPNLPAGSFAVYTKMHHSLVDGAGGASFMAALHDLVPNPTETPVDDSEPVLVDREPSTAELLGKASINRVKNTVGLVRGTAKLAAELGKFAVQVARKEISMPDVQSPKTRFNNPVGPHRVFDAVSFPLAAFKDIKNATGVKLNDVALAVVGGALQRYLVAKGETPELPLAASLPVNMRTRRAETDDNNQVGAIFASLHTDIEDPLERLKAIHVSTIEAKQFGESSPLVDALKIAGIFSPVLTKAAASLWSKRHLSRFIPLNTTTVVTNVPGPDFDLYCAGARLVQYHGLGVLTPGVGLFHTVFSQSDRITLSVLGDRDTIPDPSTYMEYLRESYEELLVAATGAGSAPAPRKAAAKKAPAKKKPVAKKAPAASDKKIAANKKSAANTKPAAKKATIKAAAKKRPAAKKAAAKKVPVIKAVSSRPRAKRRAGSVAPKLQVVRG